MVYFDVQDQLKSPGSRVTISFFAFYFLPKYNISLSAWSPREDGTPHRQDITRAYHTLEMNASPGNQTFMLPPDPRFVNLTDSTLASERCCVHTHISEMNPWQPLCLWRWLVTFFYYYPKLWCTHKLLFVLFFSSETAAWECVHIMLVIYTIHAPKEPLPRDKNVIEVPQGLCHINSMPNHIYFEVWDYRHRAHF